VLGQSRKPLRVSGVIASWFINRLHENDSSETGIPDCGPVERAAPQSFVVALPMPDVTVSPADV